MEATYEFQTPNKSIKERKKDIKSYHPSPITIPPSPLLEKLGNGTGVMVYRFQRKRKQGDERSPWAVKKTTRLRGEEKENDNQNSTNMHERLRVEASILQRLDHPNIVKFKGLYQCSSMKDTCLSMEICGRSLLDEIEDNIDNNVSFSSKNITLMAWGVAKALNYIHNTHKLLHGDIKSANILVSNDFEIIKLSDFGHSLELNNDFSNLKNENDNYIGTQPWNPKEVLEDGPVTDKADIYPYGLVIWEMMTLKIPHLDSIDSEDEEDNNKSVDDISFFSDENDERYYNLLGTRPLLPKRCTDNKDLEYIINLFNMCSYENPTDRPNAAEIEDILSPEIQKLHNDS